jgi:hypothetical protein
VTTNHADFDGPGSRAHRRTARAALAATIVLVLGGGALLAACGSEYADPAASSGEGPFLLPPEGADVQWAGGTYAGGDDPDPSRIAGYFLTWRDESGEDVQLAVTPSGGTTQSPTPSTIDFEAPESVDELLDVIELVWGKRMFNRSAMVAVDAGPLDPAASYCYQASPDIADSMVLGAVGRSLALVQTRMEQTSCEDVLRDSAALRVSRELRVVDEAEWRAFIDEWGELGPATTTTSSTTTTLDPSVTDYCAAIERLRASGAIGTDHITPAALPFLEEIRNGAPSDIRPAIERVIVWLEDGAPEPIPPEVLEAEVALTPHWTTTCEGRFS